MKKEIVVKQDTEDVIPVEIFERAIIDISNGFKRLENSRLSRRAVLLLIRDSMRSPVGMGIISDVLDSAKNLEKTYIKK